MEREAPARCIILHGCPDASHDTTYDQHWIPWASRALCEHGFIVETPRLPEPWNPDYERFKEAFERLRIDERTILIGHSCSASFLVRWLGENRHRIAHLILVAPSKQPEHQTRAAFYTYPIDATIAERVRNITIFTANDEEPQGIRSAAAFSEALGGELIVLENHGHYTFADMQSEAFPELIEAILRSDRDS
jgi:predicted alpha/beta hydrolase family esterase